MGRPRKYWSNADRQRAYRVRLGNGKVIAERYERETGKKLAPPGSTAVTKGSLKRG